MHGSVAQLNIWVRPDRQQIEAVVDLSGRIGLVRGFGLYDSLAAGYGHGDARDWIDSKDDRSLLKSTHTSSAKREHWAALCPHAHMNTHQRRGRELGRTG